MRRKRAGFLRTAGLSASDFRMYRKIHIQEDVTRYHDLELYVGSELPNGLTPYVFVDHEQYYGFLYIDDHKPLYMKAFEDVADIDNNISSDEYYRICGDRYYDDVDNLVVDTMALGYESGDLFDDVIYGFNHRDIVYNIETYDKSERVWWSIVESDTSFEVASGNVGYDYIWDLAEEQAEEYARSHNLDVA